MTQTTLSFGPQVTLLLVRGQTRQIQQLETIVKGRPNRHILVVEEEQSTLTDTLEESVEVHRQNIIYVNGVPQGFQSHDQWVKECTIHLAIWCQNQALDLALKELGLHNLDIVKETCTDIIDHVEHCSRIDMVRWLHWGTTADLGSYDRKSTQRLFGALLDCIDKFGCEESILNTLFEYSEQWLGSESISKFLEKWINNHPNTTKFHRWLRRHLHHYTNTPKPHWITHIPPMQSGWLAAGVHRDALLRFKEGLLHRSSSGKWHRLQADVPAPTAAFGLWDGSWMLISNERVTKLTIGHTESTVEEFPILTVSRKYPTIGCFQGRPYVVGGEENDHTVCELWDRREKRWVAFHMQHDHHLDDIQIFECVGGIEVLGRADSKLEHWKLMFVGDRLGEWQLLRSIDDVLNLHEFALTESGIVGLQLDDKMNVAVVEWGESQKWEHKAIIPAASNAQEWTLYPYENNQVVISQNSNSRATISILDVSTGLQNGPLLELSSIESPSFCTLADGTLLCCTKHDCHSIFV